MTEIDSVEATMEESKNLLKKAKLLIASLEHLEMEKVVKHLFMPQETNEYKSASNLYGFCEDNFSDWLSLMVLKVYKNSFIEVIRFQSLSLLSDTLRSVRLKLKRKRKFSFAALDEMKSLVISCFNMQETKVSDIKILARIVCFIAYNVAMLGQGQWEELNECIIWFTDSDQALKALLIFVELPAFYGKYISESVVNKLLEISKEVMLNPKDGKQGEWSLCLRAVYKIGVLHEKTELRANLTYDINAIVLELKNKGLVMFLDDGVDDLVDFLCRDGNVVKYSCNQREFVVKLAYQFTRGYRCAENSNMVMATVSDIVENPEKYKQDLQAVYDRDWFEHLDRYTSIEILRVFASTDLEERSRDMAIRQLNFSLSYHTSKKIGIDISVLIQLKPLLISCLSRQDVSDSMFRVLGEVVFHVANDLLINHGDKWTELWSYIGTECTREFDKAVYLFQCLTMQLADNEFVFPAIQNLLPEIRKRLIPPTVVLEDNSSWLFTFAGAFCAAIHLIEHQYHGIASDIRDQMVDTTTSIVGNGGVGLVTRALMDTQTIVGNQAEWYNEDQYGFAERFIEKFVPLFD